MAHVYGNRHGADQRPPSGGVLTRPILGLGKLPPGDYAAEVLTLTRGDARCSIIVQAPTKHCHHDQFEWLPPELKVGDRVQVKIEPVGGFIMVRDGGRYQPRTIEGEPLADWATDLAKLWDALAARRLTPATTAITELTHGGRTFRPKLYSTAPTPGTDPAPGSDPTPAG